MSIEYARRDRIATITINRPEALNAITHDMHEALANTYRKFEADDDAWVAVVRGAGDRAFSVGRDLKERADLYLTGARIRPNPAFPEIEKPVVAAIRGYALGLGFQEAMRADIRVAADDALFGLTEVRIGMVGPVEPVIRLLPFAQALYMLLTGAHVNAQQALRFGLVVDTVPAQDLENTAYAVAETICANAPLAVRATKQNAYHARFLTPESAARFTRVNGARVDQSEDVREGARAFAEKRKPRWQGR